MARDGFRRVGDFVVPESDLEEAKGEFGELSGRRQALDRGFREPIPDEKSTWEDAKWRYDYPGVDTPNETPRHAFHDTADIGDEVPVGDIGVLPIERDITDDLGEAADEQNDALDNLFEGVFGDGSGLLE